MQVGDPGLATQANAPSVLSQRMGTQRMIEANPFHGRDRLWQQLWVSRQNRHITGPASMVQGHRLGRWGHPGTSSDVLHSRVSYPGLWWRLSCCSDCSFPAMAQGSVASPVIPGAAPHLCNQLFLYLHQPELILLLATENIDW